MAEPKKEPVRIALPQGPGPTLRRPPVLQPDLKKETAHITLLPRPAPEAAMHPAPAIVATSKAIDAFDSLPGWFCWGLLGISVVIFLSQVWNYALS
jgi:hypothetical protein